MRMRCSGRVFLSLVLVALSSCSAYRVPKEYVPDKKVVYLTQNTDLGPLAYKPVAADPYVFAPDLTPVNAERPSFITSASWDALLKADFKADSRLYREVEAHFKFILSLAVVRDLRTMLDAAAIVATPALPPDHGEKIKDYSNGAVYSYPGAAGARITILDGGYYEITFPDKGYFRHQADGTYERVDAAGHFVFASFPGLSRIVSTVGDTTYTSEPGGRRLAGPRGTMRYASEPYPQYQFTRFGDTSSPVYVFFVGEIGEFDEVMIELKNGLRVDYFPRPTRRGQVEVLITRANEAIAIDQQFRKAHRGFDTVKRTTTSFLSYYLPEGIRLTNFAGRDPAFGEVRPAWPEQYRTRIVGPFDVLYTAKDEPLLGRLRADRLAAVEAGDRALTGLSAHPRRTLIIPPDLESYRKLHASRPGEILNWYPSGFETRDLIIMWPVSVPRYSAPEGQDYFFNEELYEILTHEYVHVLVGENTGIESPVPYWLNEGLAVFVESHFSPQVKKYWDLTFEVSRGLKRLLDWDLVTTSSTGALDIGRARVDYAQSYALVSALETKFGTAKVAEYVKSFRTDPADESGVDLASAYKAHFRTVFGVDFGDALKLLDR